MKKYLLPAFLILLFGSLQAAAQYIPSGSGGGGGTGSNCVLNSSPSDVMFNDGGTCAGNAGLTYNGTNTLTIGGGLNSLVTAYPSSDLRISTADGAGPGQLQLFAGTQTGVSGNGGEIQVVAGEGIGAGNFGGNAQIDAGTGASGATDGTIQLGVTGGGVTVGGPGTITDLGNGTIDVLNGYWANGNFVASAAAVSTERVPAVQVYTNDTVTGTAAGKVAVLNTTGVRTATVAETTDGIGICVSSLPNGTQCTNSGSASIAWAGYASCFFDGSTTRGDWVIISTSVAGDCSDGGTGTPANVEVLGQVMTTNVGAGLYLVSLNPVGVAAAASKKAGGGGAPTTCNSTAESNQYACRNIAASWTAGQRSTPKVVTLSTSTFTANMDDSDNFEFDLVHASCPCTIANPSNLTAGQTGVLVVKQSSTGSDTVTWGGDFVFPNGTPVLQTAANAEDYFSYYTEASNRIIAIGISYSAAAQIVNFNTANPPNFPTDTGFAVNGANGTNAGLAASAFAAPSYFRNMRADGTGASPSAVQSGDEIGGLNVRPYDGSGYAGPYGYVRFYAAENIASGHGGTKVCLATTPTASTTVADGLCQNADGSVAIASQTLTVGGNNVGGLIGVQRITATGAYTYTPDAGTHSVVIEMVGAGGGGHGVQANPGTSSTVVGQGGSGGGWCRVRLTANFSGGTGSVGAKGTGGTAGNNAGNDGGATTFITTASVTYTASGGLKGAAQGGPNSNFVGLPQAAASQTGCDDNVAGGWSAQAVAMTNTGYANPGGNSRYGNGGVGGRVGAANQNAVGGNGDGKGSGGGGAISTGSSIAAAAGGDGTDGLVIIWEYN